MGASILVPAESLREETSISYINSLQSVAIPAAVTAMTLLAAKQMTQK